VYGAGARLGALRRGAEAGRGRDVSVSRGSARTGAGLELERTCGRKRGLARGRRGGGRSVGCLPRSDPWVAGSGDE
jgi:hypothetical protein